MKVLLLVYMVFVLESVTVQANGSFEPILNHLSRSSTVNLDCRADSMCMEDSHCGTNGVCDFTKEPTSKQNMGQRVIDVG